MFSRLHTCPNSTSSFNSANLGANSPKAYLLAAAAEDAPETFAGTEKAVQGWVDCFPRCTLVGTVFAGGVNGVGEIAGHIALEQAYQMGEEV